jgi:hypothetical protein
MNEDFFNKSKEIANNFIESVIFLDDRAYKVGDKENPNHDFDTLKISQSFAKENKICAVYKPESDADIDNFKSVADKADVIILDWQIVFPQIVELGSENEDAPDDPRGIYTKDIIDSIVFEDSKIKNALKLIIIYTGDYTILEDISEEIYKDVFKSSEEYTWDKENCSIQSSEFKILVRAKKAEITNELNGKKYVEKMIQYEELPSFILNEFTKMTSGLLSNFALVSLTTLRRSSNKILGLFAKEMDSAYLSHKVLLPSQEDAEDLLIGLFGDTISDLLFYNKSNEVLRDLIEDWIKKYIQEEPKELLKKGGEKYNPTENYSRNHNLLLDLINSSNKDIEKRYVDSFSVDGLSKSKGADYYKYIALNNTLLFLNTGEEYKKETIDKKFSILTHHKSLFIPNNTIPKLTLGTILRSSKNADNYYICIQQKCDSVRIPKDQERKFLFIPLKISEDKFDILTPDGMKLKKIRDSFSIRTIKFICRDMSGVIKGVKDENHKFIFTQKYNTAEDEQFEWVFDLKDLHAQRIIIEYTSQLARVGLDESEWHRRLLS